MTSYQVGAFNDDGSFYTDAIIPVALSGGILVGLIILFIGALMNSYTLKFGWAVPNAIIYAVVIFGLVGQ